MSGMFHFLLVAETLLSFFFHMSGKDWCNWVYCWEDAPRENPAWSIYLPLRVFCICGPGFSQHSCRSIAGFEYANVEWRSWHSRWKDTDWGWFYPCWRLRSRVADTAIIHELWGERCCRTIEFKMVCHTWVLNLSVTWSKPMGCKARKKLWYEKRKLMSGTGCFWINST